MHSFAAQASVGTNVKVSLSPAGNFIAKTEEIKGQATLSNGQVKADNIVVELKTLTTGISLRDEHLKNKYLEVEKFPEAILTAGSGKDGKGKAQLKVHGIQKEIDGTYELDQKTKELNATFNIKLSDFGITGIKYLGVGVKDDVKITATIPYTEEK